MLTVAKFKIHHCIPVTGSPNLMLTKVSRYTVCGSTGQFFFCLVYQLLEKIGEGGDNQ